MSDPFCQNQSQYYLAELYPLQYRVLYSVGSVVSDFYLTGGTALSHFYLQHRFSDDLDFFVNRIDGFKNQVQSVFKQLRDDHISFDVGSQYEDFVSILAREKQTVLKIDFVNDVAAHFGGFHSNRLFPKIDSWQNILSNKICALSRLEAKDFVDIIFIAKSFPFNWEEMISNAREKDEWVEPVSVSELFKGMPLELLKPIKWMQPVDYHLIYDTLKVISKDVLLGRSNSLLT